MDTQSPVSAAAQKILGAEGKKLHTHGMHIRRTANGFIAKHELGDKHGRPPTDGQRSEKEYNVATPEELAQHVQSAMQPIPQQDDEQQPGT